MRRVALALLVACGSAAKPSDWHGDLAALATELAKHPNKSVETAWRGAARDLDAQLDRLDDAHAMVGLVRVAATLGDSHTRVFLPRDKLYAVRFLGFEDGIFVAGGDASAIGHKVTAIDGAPIDDVLVKLAPLVATDNNAHRDAEMPQLLENPVAMAGIDAAKPDVLHVTLDNGKTIDAPAGTATVDLALPDPKPLHLQGPTQLAYWNKYDEANQLLYFQYNACEDDKRVGPFAKFAAATLAFADQHPVKRFVIDLRSNQGGNSLVIEPLIDGLATRNIPVFVLIGRVTFSSALLNAIELQQRAKATLVGAPTGGNPNSYGEIKIFKLPKSQLVGQHSTKKFFDRVHTHESLEPDVPVHVKGADWFAGRDPAIDAVLAR